MALQSAEHSPNKMQEDAEHARTGIAQNTDDQPKNEDDWLLIARDAYTEAESYYESNIRFEHEKNLAHFQGRHAPGSKYYSEAYKFRHKGFRPKTRSFVRRQESALLKSMFSTADFVKVQAARTSKPEHRISAEINQSLLQYRLENTIPWMVTALGAYQETLNMGICISHQCWDYEEEGQGFDDEDYDEVMSPWDDQNETESEAPQDPNMVEDMNSNWLKDAIEESSNVVQGDFNAKRAVIVKDTPAIELRPVENVFFSVACDWRDPANTSPFIIDKVPMYVDEVKAMANPSPGSNRQPWYEVSDQVLMAGVTDHNNSVRRQREKNREDSTDQRFIVRGFDTVWVHRNIVRRFGRDWVYYTLGVHYRLSDPVPLRDEYPWLRPGERPYVIGFANIEAHKNYPDSLVGLGSRTQQDANELNNTRFDNVELSLNRRYITKRSAMIDYRGLQRNVPGGVTETDDPNNDIRIEQPPDVTGSSYQEQDRINADYDELLGMFSGSSVQNNRAMNETVGGMKLLQGDADSLTEYPLMVFMITWVLPVLKQVVRLEQAHEADPALLNLMGEKVKFWQRFRIRGSENQHITDQMIQGSMNLQIAAGMGAANPDARINRLAQGFGILFQMAPEMRQRFDAMEAAKEILGGMGYTMGHERFFPEGGPQIPGQAPPTDGQITEQDQAQMDQDFKRDAAKMQQDEDKMAWEREKFLMEREDKALERELKKVLSDQQFEEVMTRIRTDRQNRVDEMRMKMRTGQQGI